MDQEGCNNATQRKLILETKLTAVRPVNERYSVAPSGKLCSRAGTNEANWHR
jgi:hypothetical protein